MSLARADHVTRRFGKAVAVDDVSFSVEAGEVVGLLGANGAGKTTLIRMLLGLLVPTSGRLSLLDGPVGPEARRRVGYVPQGLGLYRELTVAENLAFVARANGVAMPELEPGLAEVADRRVGEISLGLRRRAAFAAARSHDPALLILDEPTSGVGPLGRARLWETIRAGADAGVGVLVSTHHMEEAEQCDRVLLLAEGREVAAGPVDDLLAGRTSVAIRGAGPEAAERLRHAGLPVLADTDGWRVPGANPGDVAAVVGPVASVCSVPATFEEAFVGLATR
jgi:ABC-2 type transport system ATP-binding protein/ribosome-dependent ATPase